MPPRELEVVGSVGVDMAEGSQQPGRADHGDMTESTGSTGRSTRTRYRCSHGRRRDGEINRLSREVFNRAVEVGGNLQLREWAMCMILVARCLERIAENAVNIAEQTVFVVIGLFREVESDSQLT